VIIFCVNDGAVMDAWAEKQGVDQGGFIKMMGDPTGALTRAVGMTLDHPGPRGKGLINRCKRHAIYLVNGVAKAVAVSEASDDPAGDDRPEATCAPAMLEAINGLLKSEL